MSFSIESLKEEVAKREAAVIDLQKCAIENNAPAAVLAPLKLARQYFSMLQDPSNILDDIFYIYGRACWNQGAAQARLLMKDE